MTTPECLAQLRQIGSGPPAGEAAILAEIKELVAEHILVLVDADEQTEAGDQPASFPAPEEPGR
jgi:hypothetical protein